MKKLILLFSFIILSNCDVSPRSANAKEHEYNSLYSFRIEDHNGMKYGIWYLNNYTSQTGYAIHVINLTKDQLEIELLRHQLNEYNLKNAIDRAIEP